MKIEELINQAKTGDQKAFNKLYEMYHKLIRYIIYDIVKDEEVTADLVSITFIKAFKKISSYTNISFEAWLKTIAVNTTIDYIRSVKDKEKNYSIDNEESNIQIADDNLLDPESDMIKKENIKLLNMAMSRMSAPYRNILKLRYHDALSYEQLSAELNVPIGTIKSNLNKAKHKLRKIFNKLSKIN